MRKKYRRTWTVILAIFIIAVLAVISVAVVLYFNGFRYIKSDAGIKFFGTVDKSGDIVSGRLWYENDSAQISLQKYYILESKDGSVILPGPIDMENGTVMFPFAEVDFFLDEYIFNKSDDEALLRTETIEVLIKDYENLKNNIKSAVIYDDVLRKWILSETNANPSSYKDYDVVQELLKTEKFNGDILSFLKNEDFTFAAIELKNGNTINLYAAPKNLYRLDYDEGIHAGDLYIGEINKDYQNHDDKGLYFFNKTGDIYSGNFQNGERSGFGIFESGAGDRYAGNMLDGKKHGEGLFEWTDCASYNGEFFENMKHGHGKNIFANGSIYEGDYKNDVKHGVGKYTWITNGEIKDVYEGDFENDLYKGQGKYTWESGEYYMGDFDHNTLHGWGTYHWTSGRSYTGWFSRGVMVFDRPDDVTHRDDDGNLTE